MSTGCNCEFHEIEPGVWYYLLEDTHAPKNAWDWREYADAYGPFGSEQEARDHLGDHHANPGGSSTYAYEPGHPQSAVMQELLARAPKNMARLTESRGRWSWP
jgi:hypothetical protein